MDFARANLKPAAFYLTLAAVAASLISIAACQILIGLAFLALLASGERLRLPPVKLPLALFMLGTALSCLFADDPAAGLPQIRKFYVLLTLPIVYTAFRRLEQVNRLVVVLGAVAAASGITGLVQFGLKWKAASEEGASFYMYYVGERITGFMSHWQTFGGQMMLVFLLAAAAVLFANLPRRNRLWWIACAAVLSAAIVGGWTRNIWLGSTAAGLYLLWHWNKKLILLVPIALALLIAAGPDALRERFTSLVKPHGEADSNQHRIVTYRTGLRMIQAHPLLGLGPERVGARFEEFVPGDVPRPLPDGWYGHLHNIYLHYAAERGIPALLCLLWFLVRMLRDFTRAARRMAPRDGGWLLRGAGAAVIAIMVSGLFELNLGDTEVLTLFLAIAACGYAVIEAQAAATNQRLSPKTA